MFSSSGAEVVHHPARRWSLALRLTAWYALTAFLLLLFPTLYLYVVMTRDIYRADASDVRERMSVIRALLEHQPINAEALRREVEIEPSARPTAAYMVRVLDETGNVVDQTPKLADRVPSNVFPIARPVEWAPRPPGERPPIFQASDGRQFMIASALIVSKTADTPAGPDAAPARSYVLQLAVDETSDQELLAAYRTRIWVVMGLGLLASIGIGYWIARRGMRPIRQMGNVIEGINSTQLDQRIDSEGYPSEMWLLSVAFNRMLERLQNAFERLSRFSADIAHELRTPVSNLRGETEVTLSKTRSPEEYREVLSSCLEEYQRLSRMIDSLLFLARAENPETRIERELLDLQRELESIRVFFEAPAEEAGVQLTVNVSNGLKASLDRILLQRAVGNLVENALGHTPRGGQVQIRAAMLHTDANHGHAPVVIEVIDNGCGIPASHLPYVFDRFRRVDESRTRSIGPNRRAGLGLGLAIVKGIATVHGGAARIESDVGKGTRVTLEFPG